MHTSFIHKPSLKPWREWQMPSTFILLYNIFLILPLQNPIYFIPEEISWASPGFTVLWSFWQDRPWFWWWWWGGLGPIILDLINQNPQPFANGFTSTLAYKQQTTQIPHWLNLEWGSTGWARPAPSQSNFGDPWSHGQLRKRFIHPNPPQTPFASDLRIPPIWNHGASANQGRIPVLSNPTGHKPRPVVFAQWFGGDRRFRRKRRSFKGWNIESMPVQTSAPYFRYLRWLKPSQVFRKCCFHVTCPSRMLFYQYLPWPL